MAFFPLFVNVKEKKCVIVGGGAIALRKIMVLLQFDMQLEIIAPEVCAQIEELGIQGKVRTIMKEYSEQDIDDAFMVIAATSSPEINERVYLDAMKRLLPVNVVDDPERCTFIFPSIVKRGELVIGISTSGRYPAMSKRIRKTLEQTYTEEYAGILDCLSDFRVKVRNTPEVDVPGWDMDETRGKVISQKGFTREILLGQVLDELYEKGDITSAAMKKILLEYGKK